VQWKYHGQINFVFTPADVIRYSAADVQCSGHHRSGKIQWETGIGGGWFNHRPDQCFYQSFYRYFAWGKCTGGKVLCDGQIKRNVGNSTYFDHAGDGQRCDHGICRCSVCERCTGIDGNAG